MPELPDVELYVEALASRVEGAVLSGFRVASPGVVRTLIPDDLAGRTVNRVSRVAKRIVLHFGDGSWCAIHLMVAGRLRWVGRPGASLPRRVGLAAWDFSEGTLLLTEQGTVRRAGVWFGSHDDDPAALHPGGVEPLEVGLEEFARVIRSENRTLKRLLCDQRLVAGIGNAYSDEILWRACLSPTARSGSLDDASIASLWRAIREVLAEWLDRLRAETGGGWPTKVTAFRPGMAVHGRYGQPCPRCGTPIQRIVYASNQTNYCPVCQTGGRVLADRALSRLLRDEWPRRVEDLEGL
ncbi:MAG: putative formamidopyrimidine-DNA glycosylase [Acidimicrobiia bacterium]|nr:MAG: putative formamidopyrimidine-DNA glycosylase [Acidimicrobiia bacterium]